MSLMSLNVLTCPSYFLRIDKRVFTIQMGFDKIELRSPAPKVISVISELLKLLRPVYLLI